jgi:hypothetical protein
VRWLPKHFVRLAKDLTEGPELIAEPSFHHGAKKCLSYGTNNLLFRRHYLMA